MSGVSSCTEWLRPRCACAPDSEGYVLALGEVCWYSIDPRRTRPLVLTETVTASCPDNRHRKVLYETTTKDLILGCPYGGQVPVLGGDIAGPLSAIQPQLGTHAARFQPGGCISAFQASNPVLGAQEPLRRLSLSEGAIPGPPPETQVLCLV